MTRMRPIEKGPRFFMGMISSEFGKTEKRLSRKHVSHPLRGVRFRVCSERGWWPAGGQLPPR
jgi:hypothetical protein